MKTVITAQQLVYFRQHGQIRFEGFPVDFAAIQTAAEKATAKRDLWRDNPFLKKLIERDLAPLALELTGRKRLRIGLDQWIDAPVSNGPMQALFCLQGIALVMVLTPTALDVYDPSSLASLLIPGAYLIAYAQDNARYIANTKDPFVFNLRKMGYNYGDVLINEFHPLIFPK